MAEIDPFANLTASVAELPTTIRDRGGKENPFAQLLTDSYTSNTGRKVVLAAQHVAEAVQLIRRAANKAEIGARIVLMDAKGEKADANKAGEWAKAKSNAKITVLFQGQKRRAKATRKTAEVTVTNVTTTADTNLSDVPAADAAQAADSAPAPTA